MLGVPGELQLTNAASHRLQMHAVIEVTVRNYLGLHKSALLREQLVCASYLLTYLLNAGTVF